MSAIGSVIVILWPLAFLEPVSVFLLVKDWTYLVVDSGWKIIGFVLTKKLW
jgi:hypothetical protein